MKDSLVNGRLDAATWAVLSARNPIRGLDVEKFVLDAEGSDNVYMGLSGSGEDTEKDKAAEASRRIIERDLYLYSLRFSQSRGHNPAQATSLLTLCHRLLRLASDPSVLPGDAYAQFRSQLLSHSVQRPPHAICVFPTAEVAAVAQWVTGTVFRHWRLYAMAFAEREEARVAQVGLDLGCPVGAMAMDPAVWAASALAPKDSQGEEDGKDARGKGGRPSSKAGGKKGERGDKNATHKGDHHQDDDAANAAPPKPFITGATIADPATGAVRAVPPLAVFVERSVDWPEEGEEIAPAVDQQGVEPTPRGVVRGASTSRAATPEPEPIGGGAIGENDNGNNNNNNAIDAPSDDDDDDDDLTAADMELISTIGDPALEAKIADVIAKQVRDAKRAIRTKAQQQQEQALRAMERAREAEREAQAQAGKGGKKGKK